MDFKKLTQGERITVVAGVLLIIDLLILPWHKVTGALARLAESIGGDTTSTGVQSPNSAYGVLALIVTLIVVGLIVAKLANAKLPNLPVPLSQILMIGAIVVLALLLLKLIAETDYLAFGAYLGILLAAALAFGGYSINKEAGSSNFSR